MIIQSGVLPEPCRPLAAGTAKLVLSRLALPAGARLLVLGGSGGVGTFLLQPADAAGIEIIGAGR